MYYPQSQEADAIYRKVMDECNRVLSKERPSLPKSEKRERLPKRRPCLPKTKRQEPEK